MTYLEITLYSKLDYYLNMRLKMSPFELSIMFKFENDIYLQKYVIF